VTRDEVSQRANGGQVSWLDLLDVDLDL